jgi:hypothetical protein
MVLKTHPDGGTIAQAIGSLKTIASGRNKATAGPRRFLIVALKDDSKKVVLR